MDKRTATVMEVDPEREIMLWLSNNDCLQPMDQVQWIKVMNCGVLQEHHKGIFRHVSEFKSVNVGPLSRSQWMLLGWKKLWDTSAQIT
jgi:hypothetical protein